MLIGHAGKDCEPCRFTQSGQAVCNFSIATSEKFGDNQQRTEWHNIQVWSRNAELAAQYIRKGRQVFVEGRLQTREWVDPQGVKHYKTEIVCSRFLLLGSREAPVHGSEPDAFDVGELGPPLDAVE